MPDRGSQGHLRSAPLSGDVEEYRAIADRLKEFGREGRKVAVLDTSGYQLYVTSDTAPWGRYSRLFDTLIRTEQVDQTVEMLTRL